MSGDKAKRLDISSNTLKLFEISKHLTEKELKTLKTLCCEVIPAGTLEKITTVLDLFKKIEEIDETGDGGQEFLSKLLKLIDRDDLCRKLNGLPQVDEKVVKDNKKCKINKEVLLLISNKIASDWRRLGRYLDVDDDVIDQIDADHRKSFDKSYEVLREWIKNGRDEASVENLKTCLERMGRKDIVIAIDGQNTAQDLSLCKPLQESEVSANQVRDPPQSQLHTSNGQTSSSVANFAAEPKQTNPAAPSKYNIQNFGGNVLVGDFSNVTIHQTKPPAKDSAKSIPSKMQTKKILLPSLPQDSFGGEDHSHTVTSSSSKFNVRVFGGTATVGDGLTVKVDNLKPDIVVTGKGSEENEEKKTVETAI